MMKKNLRLLTLVGSIVLSVVAYLIPLTGRVAPDGSYIGIDCEALSFEPILWILAFVCLLPACFIAGRASLKSPLIIISALMLLASFTLKFYEYREFDSQTHSSRECSIQAF